MSTETATIQQPSSIAWQPLTHELMELCNEQQSTMLGILSMSHRHGTNVVAMLRGLAQEQIPRDGRPIEALADAIESGSDPIEAICRHEELLPAPVVLNLFLAKKYNRLEDFFEVVADRSLGIHGDQDSSQATLTMLAGFYARTFAVLVIVAFFALKIIPELKKIFEEFEMEPPQSLKLLWAIFDSICTYWFLVPLSFILLFLISWPTLKKSIRLLSPRKWRDRSISPDRHVRFSLATALQYTDSVKNAVYELGRCGRFRAWQSRLERFNQRVNHGQTGWSALADENFLSARESRVLQTTTGVETQAWLLKRLARQKESKSSSNYTTFVRLFVTIGNALIAFLVFLTGATIIGSLVGLIQSAA